MISRRSILRSMGGGAIGMLMPRCAAGKAAPHPGARYWRPAGGAVRCELCPHHCLLDPGRTGTCRVRQNRGGTLVTTGYGNPCAVHVDPIEKKPLYHMLPGTKSFSIAVAGCNLRCQNCQNASISQISPAQSHTVDMPPQEVVQRAISAGCRSIAYTYSEPTVWFEYMYDTARLAREKGLKNIWVTAGFINPRPLRELASVMDGANIDLKSFSNDVYEQLNAGSLEPVLRTLSVAREEGIWVEITNLVVPQWSDDAGMIKKMSTWIVDTLGFDVPLHFSRFYPAHRLRHLPPTPRDTLDRAVSIAREAGLRYVYLGNVAGADLTTRCPSCKTAVVKREGYLVRSNVVHAGRCPMCNTAIPGVWT